MRRWLVLALVFTIIVSGLVSSLKIEPTKAATIVVPDDYPTVQQAVDAAAAGDIIYVRAGNGGSGPLHINKPLSLVGENRGNTGIGATSENESVIYIEATDHVSITHFSMGGYTYEPIMTISSSSYVNLVDCWIEAESALPCDIALEIIGSSHCTISSCTIRGWVGAMSMVSSTFNLVEKSDILAEGGALSLLSSSDSNVIKGNYIYSSRSAFGLSHSNQNTIVDNSVVSSGGDDPCFSLFQSTSNLIYHNVFYRDTPPIISSCAGNVFDNGYPSGGNYWSDYAGVDLKCGPNQDQLGGDGNGDTPYVIDSNSIDHYPLMQPWSPHTVTFKESGLPPGATWTVALKYVTQSTSDSQIIFTEVDGKCPFSVTSTSGFFASPISQGTINVDTDTSIVITWGASADVKAVLIDEIGLPPSTSWSVTYGCITNTTTHSFVGFLFFDNAVRHFSMSSVGYIAEPSPVDIPAYGITTSVIFIPDTNTFVLTNWDPCKNSYNESNTALSTPWSSKGNCYGLSSTALLYFMHYSMGKSTYPYFPSQYPLATSSTSDLDLGDKSTLNNASLALMIHQLYDPQAPSSIYRRIFNDNAKNFVTLDSSLKDGIPMIMTLWDSKNWSIDEHSVVAWGLGKLSNGSYAIAVYDPNFQETTQVAIYDSGSNTFSCAATGPYDSFLVINPGEIDMSWRFPAWWWPGSNWIDFAPITSYYVVIADKNVTVEQDGSKDTFSGMGNSQSFAKGIPDSCGIEEGNLQAYAVHGVTAPKIYDPSSSESTIFISRIDNESGQFVEYAYLLNATTTQAYLNYTVTPTNSGLWIVAGDTPLNATVTCFSASQQGYSASDVLTAQINAGQSANLAAPCLASFAAFKNIVGKGYAVPMNVTITNVGNNPENVSITLYANETTMDSETVFNLLNGTSINLVFGGNTSSCAYGNYTLSAYCAPNGINEAANNFTYTGSVTITIPGDVNGDFTVDIYDAILLAGGFNTNPGNLHWNANADINGDNFIDIYDAIIIAGHFNQHYP